MKKIFTKSLFIILALILAIFFASSFTYNFLKPAHAQTTCPVTPTSTDSITATVTISANGTYTIWSRLLTPDAINDSYYLQIDGGCAINVGDAGIIPANTWTWVNYQDGNTASPTTLSLATGSHVVKLIGRESNVAVDRILFVADNCIPSGIGDNCNYGPTITIVPTATNTPTLIPPMATPTPVVDTIPPTVNITNPANGATIQRGRNLTLSATASDNVSVARVIFTTNNGFSCTATIAPYSCVWNVSNKPNTTYTITATAYDAAGNHAVTSVQVRSSK